MYRSERSAMPKRSGSADAGAIKVEQVACVIRGGKSEPLPIPTVTECGVTCVPINSSAHWLNRIVGDRVRGDGQLVLKEFIDGILVELAKDREAATRTEEGSSGGRGSGATEAPLGRSAMGLDEDSEEEVLAEMPMKKPVRGRKINKQTELRTISFRGMELTVKARDKGRGLVVPLKGDTLVKILNHLREHMGAAELPETDPTKSEQRKEVVNCREDEDGGANSLDVRRSLVCGFLRR